LQAIPHRPQRISGALDLRRHARRKGPKQGRVDRLARPRYGCESRNRLATSGDVDRSPCLDTIDELAQMSFGIRKTDRLQVTLLTMSQVI
jgi:hypothetical protein